MLRRKGEGARHKMLFSRFTDGAHWGREAFGYYCYHRCQT